MAAVLKVARSHIDGNGGILARLESRALDGLDHPFEAGLVGLEPRRVAPFVGNAGLVHSSRFQNVFHGPVNRHHVLKRLGIAARAQRDHLKVLEVDVPAAVNAAAQDVDHGHGQLRGGRPAQISVKRQAGRGRRRPSHGERRSENRIRPQAPLARGPVELDQSIIQGGLLRCFDTPQGRRNRVLDVRDRLERPAPGVPLGVAIAQLERLGLARRGAGGHEGAPRGAVVEPDLDFNGRIAARVEHFARANRADVCHVCGEGRGFNSAVKRDKRTK